VYIIIIFDGIYFYYVIIKNAIFKKIAFCIIYHYFITCYKQARVSTQGISSIFFKINKLGQMVRSCKLEYGVVERVSCNKNVKEKKKL
jgi:hypothetical protein